MPNRHAPQRSDGSDALVEGLRRELAELAGPPQRPHPAPPADPRVAACDRIADRIVAAPLSEVARDHALRGLESLRSAVPDAPATARLRNHLEWLLDLPWARPRRMLAEKESFERVARKLERSHCGLASVLVRLVEFLALRQLGGAVGGSVLCFHGAPGTG
jgi:ATP-dependent Lon protease